MTTKTRQYLSIALALLILFGGWWYFNKSNSAKDVDTPPVTQKEPEKPVMKGLVVEAPKPDQIVVFPLTVKGNITGEEGWIAYEAQTGVVQLFDANNVAMSDATPLTATEDWMQPVVHFETILGNATTTTLTTAVTGYLLFTAENPSGEGDAKTYKLPVKFN